MAHAQKTDLVFRRNGRVHLNRRGRQFSWLLAAKVFTSAVVTLDMPLSEVVWEYWLPTPFASFPFTSPPVRHRVPSGFKRTLPILNALCFLLFVYVMFWRPLMFWHWSWLHITNQWSVRLVCRLISQWLDFCWCCQTECLNSITLLLPTYWHACDTFCIYIFPSSFDIRQEWLFLFVLYNSNQWHYRPF